MTCIVRDLSSKKNGRSGGMIRLQDCRRVLEVGAFRKRGATVFHIPESPQPQYFPAGGASVYRTAGPCLTESCDLIAGSFP